LKFRPMPQRTDFKAPCSDCHSSPNPRPHGWVQIQLKQKQRAVGYQAMVYVCLPMAEVLAMDGSPRKPGGARSKETVYYDFTRANSDLLLDIIHAFGIASQQHNEDIRQILGKILETAGN